MNLYDFLSCCCVTFLIKWGNKMQVGVLLHFPPQCFSYSLNSLYEIISSRNLQVLDYFLFSCRRQAYQFFTWKGERHDILMVEKLKQV